MEALDMEGAKKPEIHLTSASAFVEGGIQDACDEACSICLEEFSESDPSTVTACKHEFHLQCILEWCQRSSQCPMCWQDISLKDPTSQELLEAVERERKLRAAPARNATIFHHPTLGDFELQHLPVGANDELEERIIQHLAAAAAMGRVRHIGRREGHRNLSSHGHRHYLVFAPHASTPGSESEGATVNIPSPSAPGSYRREESPRQTPNVTAQAGQYSGSGSGSVSLVANRPGIPQSNRNISGSSSVQDQDRAGPSELQSISESLKSRFSTLSNRYKESISRSARGWKERFFSRATTMSDLGSEVRREVNAGIASVSRMMERLETNNNRDSQGSASTHHSSDGSAAQDDLNSSETREDDNASNQVGPNSHPNGSIST